MTDVAASFWTDDRVQRLAALARRHYSPQIAKALGTTPAAVLSKATRSGIVLKGAARHENPRWRKVLDALRAGYDTSRKISDETGIEVRYVADLLVRLERKGKARRAPEVPPDVAGRERPLIVWRAA